MSTPVPLTSPNLEHSVDGESRECVKETQKIPTHTHNLSPGKLRKSPHIGHQLDEATEESSVEGKWNDEANAYPFAASPRLNQIRTRFSEQLSPTIQSSHSPDFKKSETPQLLPTSAGRMNPQLAQEMPSKFTTNFPPMPENNHASFSKEILSPRFQAIMRLTSGRKRHGRDVKSFSHELNSKGVRPYPHWKPRAANRIEEIMAAVKAKFYRLKEEVNGDLSIFAGDLVGILDDSSLTHPQWRENLEDLLVIARHCALMSADDFWVKCENIVQNLDDRRQDLPVGPLKQAHSRILFILTRCTRLVQFHKEGGHEDGHILGLHQFSDLGVYSEQISEATSPNLSIKQKDNNTEKAAESSHRQYQSTIVGKQAFLTESFFGNTDDEVGTASSAESTSSYRMSSWRRFPSPCEKNKKFGTDDADFTSTISSNLLYIKDEGETRTSDESTYGSGMRTSTSGSPDLTTSQTKRVSWGPLINQKIMASENMMICRICEVEIPILNVEEHSKICTIVDRCDMKGLTVNERLERVSETLGRILESWMPKGETFDGGRSPRMTRMSKCYGSDEADELLRRQNDLGGRITEEIFEYASVGDVVILPEGHSLLSDSGKDSSSSESLTPRSPLLTPRINQTELLFSHPTVRENDDWQQVLKLMNIARSIADANKIENATLEYVVYCLEELRYVARNRKADALVIDTFGRCIERLLQEKYAQLCGQIEEDPADEESSTEDEMSHSLRASPVYACSKDRTSIEDFEIIKPISRGAYGRVFLAKKRATGDLFAIKVLKKVDMIRKNAVDSILAERNILISVRNPFVVRFFYSFTCRENLYLVMEYLNGGDLYSLLKNLGCLDEDMARSYIAEIVLALEYLHSLNVVHRDLKPDNLLIGPDGHIKLTDFGLSKVGLINSTDELSSTGQRHAVVGTPDYLAPEILLGMGHGPTADWWSVGVILFELLVGVPPFNAENPQQIFDNIMNRDIPWPRIPEEMSYDAYDLIDGLLGENGVQRLGVTGAGEVKRHAFFRGIDWGTVARQKAIFVPASDLVEDTSYFTSRCVWNADDDEDGGDVDADETSDTCSPSFSGSSLHDEDGDEFGSLTSFGPSPPAAKHSFSNFSFKNLSQLASINYDLLIKTSKGSPPSAD